MKKSLLLPVMMVCANCAFADPEHPSCQHEWIRDPEKMGLMYCSLPPQYDWICTKCGDRKVAPDPAERHLYKIPSMEDVEIDADIGYNPFQPLNEE